jgi:hypothetical protein
MLQDPFYVTKIKDPEDLSPYRLTMLAFQLGSCSVTLQKVTLHVSSSSQIVDSALLCTRLTQIRRLELKGTSQMS